MDLEFWTKWRFKPGDLVTWSEYADEPLFDTTGTGMLTEYISISVRDTYQQKPPFEVVGVYEHPTWGHRYVRHPQAVSIKLSAERIVCVRGETLRPHQSQTQN
ncbi:MAG: hypothetical protein COT89_02795 [Candidatus Colwellbacteria bacterium CG10_big_fil_rev_8_21_14_0_10_42_22]|uniref:Uncharacterized protein n=1 Tax=Candidatus Colwellbacteria bacterium CG10_big_fil_rev_8_21_14_0_10_42_22 TaxID=1974540 RepID=A0A2H0VFH3_9BACT|nr:MAG: hypothetical protein COT89_02795 [Candidatus Colwellbacteria bacterium CG10_big_fil_rev_8_21_14_0_10_42_22]